MKTRRRPGRPSDTEGIARPARQHASLPAEVWSMIFAYLDVERLKMHVAMTPECATNFVRLLRLTQLDRLDIKEMLPPAILVALEGTRGTLRTLIIDRLHPTYAVCVPNLQGLEGRAVTYLLNTPPTQFPTLPTTLQRIKLTRPRLQEQEELLLILLLSKPGYSSSLRKISAAPNPADDPCPWGTYRIRRELLRVCEKRSIKFTFPHISR